MTRPIDNLNAGGVSNLQLSLIQEKEAQKPTVRSNGNSLEPQDRVEFSRQGERLANLEQVRAQRDARIAGIREEIRNGTYETEARIGTVVDRLFGELSAIDVKA